MQNKKINQLLNLNESIKSKQFEDYDKAITETLSSNNKFKNEKIDKLSIDLKKKLVEIQNSREYQEIKKVVEGDFDTGFKSYFMEGYFSIMRSEERVVTRLIALIDSLRTEIEKEMSTSADPQDDDDGSIKKNTFMVSSSESGSGSESGSEAEVKKKKKFRDSISSSSDSEGDLNKKIRMLIYISSESEEEAQKKKKFRDLISSIYDSEEEVKTIKKEENSSRSESEEEFLKMNKAIKKMLVKKKNHSRKCVQK